MDGRRDTRIERKRAALALLCVAQFVDVLDVNAVIVALHSIGEDLGFSRAGLQWVVSAYVLFFAGFLLLSGRGAELWGRRGAFVVGAGLRFWRAGLQWVVSAYGVFFAGFLLLSGRVADLWGRRRTFVVGLALFTAASLCCGLSVSPERLGTSGASRAAG